jgi:gamma-glutamylputrescine oxidase
MLKWLCGAWSVGAVALGVYIEYEQPRRDGSVSLSSVTHLPKNDDEKRLEGYPRTYYRDNLREELHWRGRVEEDEEVDVCVVGGGLAGLATALGLAERGKKVVILESRRIAWNASGRNGGFAIPGLSVDPAEMIRQFGPSDARAIYQRTLSAAALLKDRIAKYSIDCDLQLHGSLTVSVFPSTADAAQQNVELCNRVLGTHFEFWPADRVRASLHSAVYHHGVLDTDAFIVQPLALCAGLARACESLGVRIYEDSPASRLHFDSLHDRHVVMVQPGEEEGKGFKMFGRKECRIFCKAVVLTGSCQLPSSLDWIVSRSVVPYYTYIGVTEPIHDKLTRAVFSPSADFSVVDDITCLNYFRRLPDGRLLWGGRITPANHTEGWSDNVAHEIKALIIKHFPDIGTDFEIDYTWGGDIAFGPSKWPHIGHRGNRVYYATGFGGHGVVPTTMAGEMIAEAIATHNNSEIDHYQTVCPTQFAGWPFDRIGARLYIWFNSLCDHFRS